VLKSLVGFKFVNLEEPRHEIVRGSLREGLTQSVEHLLLHVDDLLGSVRTIADVHAVANVQYILRRHFFLLGSHEHRCDANQLRQEKRNEKGRGVKENSGQ
jgi:hypothetical protein